MCKVFKGYPTYLPNMTNGLNIHELDLTQSDLRCLGSDFECAALEYMWSTGEATVRDIHKGVGRRHRLAYTSVGVYLDRMREKGLVERRIVEGAGGLKYVYRPRRSKQELGEWLAARAARVLRGAFGSWAVSSFAENLTKSNSKDA